ncbi:choice-of-anchor D domain-containing protein [Arenibacter sp. M-2]|uniref:choice-of-anchor D domain-containing protein n=1 Tax=Arenibacter sp. M-2 TaxID=3053612 RepID=UPI002570F1F8|nr:choice-of-anchor D domain-containing protein [Arenibacter sp. M-2]MDL5514406.1 choice-of-anchor D domain-containing protein [Arenibacter sp. M-2]
MKKLCAILVIFGIIFSCIPDTGIDDRLDDQENSLKNILIFETGNSQFPFAFVHKNNARLYVRDLDEDGDYDGFFYKDGAYEEYIVLDEQTGLPKSKRNNEGLTVLYNFKENNEVVDMALELNGATSFVTNLTVSSTDDFITNKREVIKKTTTEEIRDIASNIELVVDVVGCAEGLAMFAVGSVGSVGTGAIPLGLLAAFKCSPMVFELSQSLLEATDTEIGQAMALDLEKVNGFIDALTCPTGIIGCTAFVVAEAAGLQAKLEELQRISAELQKDLEEFQSRSAEVTILGNLNFGEVDINDTKTEVLNIFNRGTDPITITAISVNSNAQYFQINTPLPFTLGAAGSETFSKEIKVAFAPKNAAGSFNTFLKISNDKYDPFDTKAITAIATNEDGAKIKFSGSLNYNGVAMNQPHSEFFDIENPNLNDNLVVNAISFEGLPTDKFSINGWSKGTIAPGKKQEVEVVFEPTDDKEYNGFVVVDNTLDDTNNKWPVFGKGKKLEIRLSGDLDFGHVAVGESETLPVEIENPNLNDPITVTDIEMLEGFSVDWKAGSIPPFSKKTVNVTFTPKEEKEYASSFIVVNDVDQENNRISLKGNAENYLSGVWKLQLINSSNDQIIMNELITFNTEENKINLELEGGSTYIENSYHFKNGLNINLIVESNISDACADDVDSPPLQSTQQISLNIHTARIQFFPYVRSGEYSMIIKMTPSVPCISDYPNTVGRVSLVRQ